MLVFWETIKYKKKLFQCWANSVAHQVRYDVCSLSTAVWPSLKLTGDEGFLLLRFRPRTVLPLVRTPDHAPSQRPGRVAVCTCEQTSVVVTRQWAFEWRRQSTTECRCWMCSGGESILTSWSSTSLVHCKEEQPLVELRLVGILFVSWNMISYLWFMCVCVFSAWLCVNKEHDHI